MQLARLEHPAQDGQRQPGRPRTPSPARGQSRFAALAVRSLRAATQNAARRPSRQGEARCPCHDDAASDGLWREHSNDDNVDRRPRGSRVIARGRRGVVITAPGRDCRDHPAPATTNTTGAPRRLRRASRFRVQRRSRSTVSVTGHGRRRQGGSSPNEAERPTTNLSTLATYQRRPPLSQGSAEGRGQHHRYAVRGLAVLESDERSER